MAVSPVSPLLHVVVGLACYLYDHAPRLLGDLVRRAPRGRTLQERYPAAPGAFVTSYSSITLTDEHFVPRARGAR
jgi:hypothetical protein